MWPLREIDAETIAAFQGELLRSGVGPQAIRKAMTLLGAILQRAAEGRRIPYNPHRVVRKLRLPLSAEVRAGGAGAGRGDAARRPSCVTRPSCLSWRMRACARA